MDIATILGSISGGVLGFAGSLVTKLVGIYERKREHQMKLEEMRLSQEIDAQKAAAYLAQTREQQAGEAFTAAVKAQGTAQSSTPWVGDAVALFRPGLTLLLLSFALAISFFVADETRDYIAVSFVQIGITAAGYWFGARSFEKIPSFTLRKP